MQFKFTRTHAILAAVVVTLLVIVISIASSFSSIKKEGVDRETALTSQYLDNQNELSKYISGFYEQLGVADRKSEQLNTILVEAIKGRYEGNTSAQPGQGQLFSAIAEAYPELTQLDVYDKVVDYIASNRESYATKQTKLLDMLSRYDNWRNTGLLHEPMVSMMGFPSDTLRAQIGNDITRGEDALDQMYRIVTTEQGSEAYRSGTMDPLTVDPAK